MKKTISINIAGVVFHIEEDGYGKLKDYLTSIHRYFSNYPDSNEILADIESRIAERFLIKQKNENKQAITVEDVEELIHAMGTVADFAANETNADYLDDDDMFGFSATVPEPEPASEFHKETTEGPTEGNKAKSTTIYRDLNRKLLGGVAAGLAHRFSVDPLWIRLLFLFLVIGIPSILGSLNLEPFMSLSGLSFIIYIAMWIAFPGSTTLEDDKNIKKFYRNPDQKVVGGVASGLASYFGIETGLVRLLFVLSIFLFGGGMIIYIILWIIAPAANTLTEKMEMQGQPITLSNIETNIKEGLNLKDKDGESNSLGQIILLPFKLIALFIGFLGKLFKGLGPIIRIIVGLILTLTAASSILTMIFGASIGYGLKDVLPFGSGVPTLIINELPGLLLFSGMLFLMIPCIAMLLLGLTLLANRSVVNNSIWLSLLGLWFICLLGAAIGGSSFSKNFIRTGEAQSEVSYSIRNGILKLDQKHTNSSFPYDFAFIKLKGYNGDSIIVQKVTSAKGRTIENAQENALAFKYNVTQKDSILFFDDRYNFNEGDWFRAQDMDVTLLIPYDYPFAMSSAFYLNKLGNYQHWNDQKLKNYNMRHSDMNWEQLRWVITRDSGLVCTNISDKFLNPAKNSLSESENLKDSENDIQAGWHTKGSFIQDVQVSDFNKVNISDHFVVLIKKGSDFQVQIDGEEKDVNEVLAEVRDNQLYISMKNPINPLNINRNTVGVEITVPDIKAVSLTGAIQGRISGFNNLEHLSLNITGACHTEMSATVEDLEAEITGASHLTLTGYAKNLKAEVTGVSHLNAENMMVSKADISASGTSHASLGKIENLKSKASGLSKIESKK